MKKVRIDRWDAALPEALRWRAYEAFARCRYAGFLAWCAKEIPETSVPSRTALYAWASQMRTQEQAHRLCNARQAQAEAGQIAEAGGVADETLAAALKALASDIVLRTGNVADATALIKSAVALRESGTKAEALALMAEETRALATCIGREVPEVRVGDPRSRWGSCAADGRIAYSWRLILAPEPVRRSVVAHEVAHLVEMNHGVRFWRLATDLLGEPHDAARGWLRANGPLLLSYGAT